MTWPYMLTGRFKRSFAVKEEAAHQLNLHHQHFLQRMVFTDDCRSWYKGGRREGKVIGIWPGQLTLSPSLEECLSKSVTILIETPH